MNSAEAARAVKKYGSQAAAARALGISRTSFRRALAAPKRDKPDGRDQKIASLEAQLKAFHAARPKAKPRAKIGKEDTRVILRPDVHGYNQDPAAVHAYLEALRILKPDHVIGLGDLIDCGAFLAEKHVWGYVAETAYSVPQDFAAAGAFLDAEAEASGGCEHTEVEGNHDARLEKWAITQAQRNGSGSVAETAQWLIDLTAPEKILDFAGRGFRHIKRGQCYDGLTVPGHMRLGKALITHGTFTGVDCCRRALAAYGTNIFFGHTHRLIEYVSHTIAQGQIGAWTCGFLAKRQPYWRHTQPTGWAHGFTEIRLAKSGAFQAHNIKIVDGVALL